MLNIFAVGLGGMIGAVFRHIISLWAIKLNPSFPYGTLFVNVLGGFLIGMIMYLSINTNNINPALRLFLTTGLMGGLTTFSTFSYETVGMFNANLYSLGIINIITNLTLSLIGVGLGRIVGGVIIN